MKTFAREDLINFLRVLDVTLASPFEMILIGGTAAALAYNVSRATRDIDVISHIDGALDSYKIAQEKTGLKIPIEVVTVHDAPFEYEGRLMLIKEFKFQNLVLKVPEIHDLILMKTVRGYEHDFEVIEEMIALNKVSKDILKERIKNEMSHVIGNPKVLKVKYEAMLELFG